MSKPQRPAANQPPASSLRGEDHFQRFVRLLQLEAEAEKQVLLERTARLTGAQAEQAGTAIVDLVIEDESAGLGGRTIVSLVKRNRTLSLPWSRLGTGSPVLLVPEEIDNVAVRGVVAQRSERHIAVAVPEMPDELAEYTAWRVQLSSDEVSRLRQRNALLDARNVRSGRTAELRNVLLAEKPPRLGRERPWTPLNTALNDSQLEAIRFALQTEDVAIIHGPPGTGKTTTVVEYIREEIARGKRVLACAGSNLAVDNMLERLVAAGEKAVRLGHPARVMEELREHTLDLLVEEHEDVRTAHKLIKEAMALRRKAGKYTRAKPLPGAKQEMRAEARELMNDARRLEKLAVDHILDSASVLCATLTGLHSDILADRRFDVCVIDEAGQTTEPPCWIPLLRCDKLVLAGDHCQLPPTVVSREAESQGLSISLLERLATKDAKDVSRRLIVQYRMHQAIMEFSSQEFYDAELVAHSSVAGHVLCELEGVERSTLTETPLEFLDTAGAGYDEQEEPDGESRLNPAEAEKVVAKVSSLLAAGVRGDQIAVIAPYSAQVRHLRDQLDVPGLEIDSVDGFQGREKEAVIVSLVRSNTNCEIGFLGDTRRMNVALTRARRKLIVIGDSATLSSHPFYRDLIEHFEQAGAYKTVWEE